MVYIRKKRDFDKPPTVSKKRISAFLSSGVLFLAFGVLLLTIDPILIIAKFNTRVGNGTYIHRTLEKELDGVHIAAFIFNVTNAERFLSGDDPKLKVEEVGPFTYKEIRKNEDLEIDSSAGVIRYSPKIDAYFVPEESVGNPADINVTVPNIAMLSMTSMMSEFPFWTRMGYNVLAKNIHSKPIVNTSAQQYLWGMDEPLIRLGNTLVPGWIHFSSLGLMDRLYDQKNRYKLEVGATNSDKFQIKTLNGNKGLHMWDYSDPEKRTRCNSFVDAYEGIAYPTDLTPDTPLRLYRNVLCRMMELDFREKRTMDYGAEALVFTISNRTYNMNPDKECLCKTTCIDGLSDLSPCFFGLPLASSHAHFLYGDPSLTERIEGLNPSEEKHGSEFLIEPKIGAVLATHFSVQVNIVVKDIRFNNAAKQFSDMVVPVAYFNIIQPDLPDQNKSDMRLMYVTGPYLLLGIQIITFIIGFYLLYNTLRLVYWNLILTDGRGMAFQLPAEGKATILTIEDHCNIGYEKR